MQCISVDVEQYIQMNVALERNKLLEIEKEEMKKENEGLKRENYEMMKEIDNLRKQLIEEKVSRESSKIDLAKMQGSLYKVEGEKNILQYQVDTLKNDITSLQAKLDYLLQHKKEEGIVLPTKREITQNNLGISSILPADSLIM